MAAYQAHPSLGFSRQEHWSGLPFPSPMHESEKWKWSRSVVSDPKRPHGLQSSRLLCPWDFPGKSTGVGCHCLLQLLSLGLIISHYWDKTSLGTLPSAPWIVRLSNLVGEKRNYSWPCVSTRDYSFWSFRMVLSLDSSNFHICMGWSPLFLENMVSYIISLFQVEWQI